MLLARFPRPSAAPSRRSRATHRLGLCATVVLALACAVSAPAAEDPPQAPPAESPFAEVDSMLEALREIMGFGPRRPIRLGTLGKAQFQRLFREQMREEHTPRQIRNETLFLRLFGLVPEDFDYERTILDLMSEQAWALYDFKKRRLYLADWAPAEARSYALLHELVHAIDDQQFNLLRYVKRADGAERQLARLAVLEGQASWVMTEWAMRQSDKSLIGNKLLAIATASATRFEAEQFPVYRESPLYFRETLIFPYTDGLLFQHEMVERFGIEGLKRVFEQPPRTTQQIIQPELYLRGLDPDQPELPALKPPHGYKRVYEGIFGQLDHRILLEHHLGSQDLGALLDQWRGSQFEILENRRNGRALLRYAVQWASAAAAREYYQLYRQVCERKWSGLELVDTADGNCAGTASIGEVTLAVRGDTVLSVEGRPPAASSERGER